MSLIRVLRSDITSNELLSLPDSTSLSFLSLVFSSSNTLTNRSEMGSERAFSSVRSSRTSLILTLSFSSIFLILLSARLNQASTAFVKCTKDGSSFILVSVGKVKLTACTPSPLLLVNTDSFSQPFIATTDVTHALAFRYFDKYSSVLSFSITNFFDFCHLRTNSESWPAIKRLTPPPSDFHIPAIFKSSAI